MIIYHGRDPINTLALRELAVDVVAVDIFSNFKLDDSEDEVLTFLDLRADASFQTLITPEKLSCDLCKHGLLSSNINCIELLISDVALDKPLVTYAQELANALQRHGRVVEVRALAKPGGMTLIGPPRDEGGDWSVHFLKRFAFAALPKPDSEASPDFFSKPVDYLGFYQRQFTESLFEGPLAGLRTVLADEAHRVMPEDVVPEDELINPAYK
jgi:hypothetical protein